MKRNNKISIKKKKQRHEYRKYARVHYECTCEHDKWRRRFCDQCVNTVSLENITSWCVNMAGLLICEYNESEDGNNSPNSTDFSDCSDRSTTWWCSTQSFLQLFPGACQSVTMAQMTQTSFFSFTLDATSEGLDTLFACKNKHSKGVSQHKVNWHAEELTSLYQPLLFI